MSPEERQLLTALFDRVRTASATPRDREAESFIEQSTREQPYATYYLAQAVVVQEKGLEAAANRIRELEERIRELEAGTGEPHPAEQGGGFLSSIFGSGQPRQPAPPPSSGPWSSSRQGYRPGRDYDDGYRAPPPPPSGLWGQQAMPSAGGSFLRGALGTAAGVAGGMLLANSLSGIFGNHMNSLGWGSPFAGANPFGNEAGSAPAGETVINNYYGDDAIREASDNDNSSAGDRDSNDGWQQADFNDSDSADDQSGLDNSDFGGDDSMDV
ncbi:DUF2076 domain-containing protein [Rhizobium puerariae]|uniref:DUF2076 domain-containing protein n=1 Tax=Rhizobium puerariae TaxID=1585791 RepID=A0ABV6ADA0_9HYPH